MAKSISSVPEVAPPKVSLNQWLKANDHGHVRRIAGKELARCGGAIGCPICQAEQLLLTLMATNQRLAGTVQELNARQVRF